MWNVTIAAVEVHDAQGTLVESLAEATDDILPLGGRPKTAKKAGKK